MLSPKFLQDLSYTQVHHIPGMYALRHSRKAGSWYYVGTYKYFKNNKKSFFDKMKELGQQEELANWDLHHIVEKQHLTSFYKGAELTRLYEEVWPTILIHKDEHKAYNLTLHAKETNIIYPTSGKGATHNVKTLYNNIYSHNTVLRQIARNVLAELPRV